MICLRCDNEEFLPKQDAVIEQEFKGELFQIQTPALACSKCGYVTVDAERTEELRRRTADAYRKKHGLLTSEDIKALRRLLQDNQIQFARRVGVGEASVKRWETWLVQDKGNDELIRFKCAQALRNRLAHNPTTLWIAFEHTLEARQNGIRTFNDRHAVETPALPADRWKLPPPAGEPTGQDELQIEDPDENAAAPLARAA